MPAKRPSTNFIQELKECSRLCKWNDCHACIIANRRGSPIWRGAPVPWYLFTVLAPDGAAKDAGSTNLLDDDAARHYGQPMICELKQREGEYDPKLKLVIRNSAGVVSHIIPF